MANNNEIKQHISIAERQKWNKCCTDLASHIGSSGLANHAMGNGTVPGFSTNDYTNAEKQKLAAIDPGALNNPHPATHPYTMITGLSTVAHTGNYNDLTNIPTTFIAKGGDSATVSGGIRITIGNTAPLNPNNDKELWVDTNIYIIKVFHGNAWVPCGAVFS